MDNKKTKQQLIDAKAIREHKAVGSDNRGGQDKIDPPRFNGIRIYDKDQETWGLKNLKRYEE